MNDATVQSIQVNVNIPENYTLVEKEWLEDLIQRTLPVVWDMDDVKRESRLGSTYLVKKRILERPEFASLLKNIWYPSPGGSGSHYFDAEGMRRFLKLNMKAIHEGGK